MPSTNALPGQVNQNHLYAISQIVSQTLDWKPALDEIVKLSREFFIFDNLVVYQSSAPKYFLEVVYAKAAGRGRSAEADMAWGENIASAVIQKNSMVNEQPEGEITIANRLERPFLLGIPISIGTKVLGAFVLIRFRGPDL